ncbi:hypothetical protein [Stenotrophomonas maltophilia]|uniref:hypothetical protein n=1 Tax=Stenotrophomonas maltophilia TaxID=40324 RepID=UPI0018FE86B6|nr:hypothetical protein [Stenotrophomonas maltophilia]
MSNDNKTLADAQPGGRVRLGDAVLPCPFCGAPAERIDFGIGSGENEGGSCIACTVCQHSGPIEFGFKENFVSNWNRRTLSTRQAEGRSFQTAVAEWMGQCFLPSLYSNMTERGDRLLEEVLELLQAHGYDKARVRTLVDYVFERPIGDPAQEVGGVMVTLAGYCWVAGLDMHAAGDAELARINEPETMAKIRAKQEAKNALHFDTPLPGDAAPTEKAVDLERARDEGHDGAIRYVLGYLNGVGDCGSTAYDEILNACGRERIIRSAVEDDELEFTGLGRWVEMYGTADDRALIDSQAVGNG